MLFLVATPIGNMSEITLRAIETLNSVDYILCEDTRTSLKLLKHYDINKPLYSYHKFNENSKIDLIISDLKAGKNIALISDAGMPGISDPGNILVNACIKKSIEYTVISGPTAFCNAFILSGFEPPFSFIGFLPNKNKDIEELLVPFANINSCLIFYVSPHDISKFFQLVNKHLPNRKKCVVREISKKFEEVTFVDENLEYEGIDKGEFVVILDKPKFEEVEACNIEDEILNELKLDISKTEVAKKIAKKYNLSKNEVYKKVVELSGK